MRSVLCLLLMLQVTPELRQHVDAGLRAKAAGDLTTAAREFQRVVELAPELPAAHINLGAVYLAQKDYSRAIETLRKGLTLNADLPGAQAMLGTALLAQGYAAEAIPHLEKGQVDDLLGVALLETGRTREAVERLEAALLKRPDDPDLLYYLGQAHGQLAKQTLDRLQGIAPRSARALQLRGEALAAAGNREGAMEQWHAALLARPDLRGVHYAMGELYLKTAEYEKAEAEFRAEAQSAPGSAAAAYQIGSVLLQRGRTREALIELRRADTLQPNMPETLLALGKALLAEGDQKDAETTLRRVVAAEPQSTLAEAAHFQLAQLYRQTGRAPEAASEMDAFRKLREARK